MATRCPSNMASPGYIFVRCSEPRTQRSEVSGVQPAYFAALRVRLRKNQPLDIELMFRHNDQTNRLVRPRGRNSHATDCRIGACDNRVHDCTAASCTRRSTCEKGSLPQRPRI